MSRLNNGLIARATKAVALLAVAVAVALAVMVVEAILGNRVLTATIGEEGIVAIDDTTPWNLMMGAIYLIGFVSGLASFVVGWRRFLRRPRD